MAVHAADVLDSRIEVDTLRDALDGCGTVVGTTARRGAYRDRSRDIRSVARELAGEIASSGPDGGALPPALVFGPEDTGLTNRDVAACHHLAYVPTAHEYASLNLAQAVVVCLYELYCEIGLASQERLGPDGAGARGYPKADARAVEDMFEALQSVLAQIGFLPDENPEHIMVSLRAMLGRVGLDERELRIMRGVIRQIGWFADGGREVLLGKRARGEKLK